MKNPMELVWTIAGIAGMLGLGFVLGRMSGGVDDQDLRDSLAVYRERLNVSAVARESLVVVIKEARTLVADAEAGAARDRQRANTRVAAADRAKFRADSILAQLRTAKTAADTNRILGLACTEIRNECAELRGANADLAASLAKEADAKAGLRTEIGAHLATRKTDSTNLVTANNLIGQLEKAARGCTVPLIGMPCPTGVANYNLKTQDFSFGGGVPVKRWLTVSLTWTP